MYFTSRSNYRTRSAGYEPYLIAFLTSALLHLTVIWFLFSAPQYPDSPLSQSILVSFEAPPTIQNKRQIVSPPDKGEETPPPSSVLESERNNTVVREQIKRGAPDAAPEISQQLELPRPKESQPLEKAQKPIQRDSREKTRSLSNQPLKDGDLFLDNKTLSKNFRLVPDKVESSKDSSAQPRQRQNYRPFSRPSGSGARFLGATGSSDHLPNLPDGDITLLNTKANQYAVFVRRVATQVFTQLRIQGWEMLRSSDINSATRDATVRATLSASGQLLKVTAEGSSGSKNFDLLLINSAKIGATDPHPPAGALTKDGTIQFIFQARSWSDTFPEPRSGMMTERRWLLLGTGLE